MIYKGEYLNEISFPIGGIGTGSIGLAGNGGIMDWEIANRPQKGYFNPYTFFAIRAKLEDGSSITKVIRGDQTTYLTGQHWKVTASHIGRGVPNGTMCGFPHFRHVEFDGSFPIATLTFRDNDFPADVVLEAYNPFIPHDALNSSIPLAFFNVKIKNKSQNAEYIVTFSARNPAIPSQNINTTAEGITTLTMKSADKTPKDVGYGDITIASDHESACVQSYWYRGDWNDHTTTFWHELTTDTLHDRVYGGPGRNDVGTIITRLSVEADKEDQVSFALTWSYPTCYNYWSAYKDDNGKDVTWKNYYATVFEDSADSARYAFNHKAYLYEKTCLFRDSMQSSTLDPAVIDAVSSTLSVLKSPTVLRLEDGTLYGWEGVLEQEGSCEGTCSHVWAYTYALCFLFPELARSIHDTKLRYDTRPDGGLSFRTLLPLGRGIWDSAPCVDGQMATVFHVYREWKISGDDTWLKEHWDTVKKLIAFAWSPDNVDEWDRDRDGVLEGRQHHTLDMELFGPSAWLQGMYLAALKAGAEMADFMGDVEARELYLSLFENGYRYTKENLFNAEYFIHKVNIDDRSCVDHFGCPKYWNGEKNELKYQIAEGCGIDQLLGQWHANILGLGDIFDKEQRKTALKSMVRYLYKPSLRDHVNAWRIFALNDEGGTLTFTYPEHVRRPILPINYCDEVWTGVEYSFAGLLISEGMTEEGLSVIRSARARHNGKNRNPWNEFECGSNYARPMSGFALLPIFSGYEFDMPKGHIGFSPIIPGDFRCFWSLGNAWGDFAKTDGKTTLLLHGGELTLNTVKLGYATTISRVLADGAEVPFIFEGGTIRLSGVTVTRELEILV